MKKSILLILILLSFISFVLYFSNRSKIKSSAPPYLLEDLQPPDDVFTFLKNWKRPNSPPKIGLQVGHWQIDQMPEELKRLKGNTGSKGGGKSEWEVNYSIAEKTKTILEEKGIIVDILPAIVPPNYWADVFVAIHADGSENSLSSGFKIASPWRDFSGSANHLVDFIQEEYKKSTGLNIDPNISRNMRGYYAFVWWRYRHSIHPKTASVILETGFLTNYNDRLIIVNKPEKAAEGLSNGIFKYLAFKNLI